MASKFIDSILTPSALNVDMQPASAGNEYVSSKAANYTNDPLIAAIIQQESGGNPTIFGRETKYGKAAGLMQLIPDTARSLGLRVDEKVDERLDPVKNVEAGTRYFNDLRKQYKDDIQLALMAYNWGPSNVNNWLASGADPSKVPAETQDYVKKITSNAPSTTYAADRLLGITPPSPGNYGGSFGKAFPTGELLTSESEPANVALQSTVENMWNSFKTGVNQTQIDYSYGVRDDYEQVIDEYPIKTKRLEDQYKAGIIDDYTYQSNLQELSDNYREAQEKINKYTEDISSDEADLREAPVSKKYEYQNWLTQSKGSEADTWDRVVYTAPEVFGSSASLAASQLALTFGSKAAKQLLTGAFELALPEPTATKAAAAATLISALSLAANARDTESYAEIGGALKENQANLLQKWMEEHPGQDPTEQDLANIRIQARQGKQEMYRENMALAVPDVLEALIAPGGNLGDLFTTLSKPIRVLDRSIETVSDLNKFTKLGSTLGRGYADYLSEKFEEGFQYAAQQRQQDKALDTGLYQNKGLIRDILTDTGDVLSSLNYSPIGIVRNPDGRYSKDKNFQFSEEAGGLLSFLPAAVTTAYRVHKDISTYRKVTKALNDNPFVSADEKLFRLKTDMYQKAFENDTVHHLIEGIKSLRGQTDVNGKPLLTNDAINTEISNIKTAYEKYKPINDYVDSLGGWFTSKETKEIKAAMKQSLFHSVLGEMEYGNQLSKLNAEKYKHLSGFITDPIVNLEDLNNQITYRENLISHIENDLNNKTEESTLYDFKEKLRVIKDQLKDLKARKQNLLKENNLTGDEESADFPLELISINKDSITPSILKDLFRKRYEELKSIKDPKKAKEWLDDVKSDIDKKKEAFNSAAAKTEKPSPAPDTTEEETTSPPPPTDEEPEVITTPSGETVQKVGTLEELPILPGSEKVDERGFTTYEVLNPDGTVGTVSQEGAWYKTNETFVKGQDKHILTGVQHFLNPFQYNLSKEKATLSRVSKILGKSKEEIIQQYPQAFPAHINDALFKKILARPDYKDYIDLIVTRKFSEKNLSKNPIVFEAATGLTGLRTQGLSIIFRLTDPDDSSNVGELMEVYPADFFALKQADGTLKPIDFTDGNQMNLEKFNSMFTKFGDAPFTQDEFKEFVRNWKSVKNFKVALETGLKNVDLTEPAVLPKNSYSLRLKAQFDWTSEDKPFVKMTESPYLQNSPIYYFDINPGLSHWVTENGDDPGYSLRPGTVGYYAIATLQNGMKRWVKLTPAKIVPTTLREDFVTNSFKKVINELYELNPEDPESLKRAKEIVKSLEVFVAAYGDSDITPFADLVANRYVLKFKVAYENREASVYFDKYLKNGKEVDYNLKFILKKFNDIIDKEKLDPSKRFTVKATNFRYNTPKDLRESEFEGDVRSLFDITVSPNIVKGFSSQIILNSNENATSTSTPTTNPTPTNPSPTPAPVTKSDTSPAESNPTTNVADGLTDAERQRDERINNSANEAFKVVDKSDITYALSLDEQLDYLSKWFPETVTREDIKTLHANLANNQVAVGAAINTAIYLRDVADISDLYHEAFHIAFRNFISDARSRSYLNKVKSELKYTPEKLEAEKNKLRATGLYEGFSDQELEEQVYEEYLADNFLEWKKGQEKKSWLVQLFDKLMNLIRYLFTEDVRGLYAAIDRGYFKNSSVLKTRFNSAGSTNTAYKLLYGATQSQTSVAVKQIVGTMLDQNMSFGQTLNYFIEYYNPDSEENSKYINGNPKVAEEFKKFQDIFKSSANQRILHEEITKEFKKLSLDKKTTAEMMEEFDVISDQEQQTERQWDLSDAYVDPFTRAGRKVKSIISNTTYTSYFFGKPYQKPLDPRVFYSRLLPVLSISNTPSNMIMPKLKMLGKYDAQIQAFYEKLVKEMDYDEATREVSEKGTQLYNAVVKAFEVEQMIYLENVHNITNPAAPVNKVLTVNKIDLGEYKLSEWANFWKNNIIGATGLVNNKDKSAKIYKTISDFLGKYTEYVSNPEDASKITKGTIESLKKALGQLGIDLEVPYLLYSFGTTDEANELRQSFDAPKMTSTHLEVLLRAFRDKSDPYSEGTAINIGMYKSLRDIASGNAQFDASLILKTYQDSEGKTRYAYVSSNRILAETRRLRSLATAKAVKEEMEKNSGYLSYNPLFTSTAEAINIFNNMTIGLTGNFRVAVDETDEFSKDTREVTKNGVTGKSLDPDTMISMMHMNFLNTFQTAKTGVKYSRYWLTQISDKSTQYALDMPVTRFWENGQLSETAKTKIFNLAKQEYLRNQGKFWDYIKKDKFLLFPFLSSDLNKLSEKEFDAERDNIIAAVEIEFRALADKHKKDLADKFLLKGENILFLDNVALKEEYSTLDNYLGNFITNYFIYTTGALQLYVGDIAWTKGWDDFVKRMAGGIASGPTLGTQDFIVVHSTDIVEKLDKATLDTVSEDFEGPTSEVNTTDAQNWSTVYTKQHILDSLGELSPTLRSALNKVMEGRDKALTVKEKLEFDLNSAKLVGFGPDSKGNQQYVKQSTFFLTKGLTSYQTKEGKWEPLPHREYLHNLREYLEKLSENKSPILFSPVSANKKYKAPNPADLSKFKVGIPEVNESAITRLNGQYIRKQQENDSKSYDKIIFVRQLVDLIGAEVSDPNMRSLINDFRRDLAAIRNESFEFARRLVANQVGDVYERADITEWIDGLKHNIEMSTPDSQMLEYLSLEDVDFNLPHLEKKLKELFLNTFKGAFQKKVTGRKSTLVSPFGFMVVEDKATRRIITTEEIAKSRDPRVYKDSEKYTIRELNIHKLENGEIRDAEFLMTRKTAEMMGINITDPTKEDYLKVFGNRIPLQAKNMSAVGRIVDFLPDYYGDVIVGPKELVYLGGMDFDVDSLYMFLQNFFINEEGETVRYGDEKSDAERYYGFKQFLLKNNTIISRAVYKQLLNTPDYKILKVEIPLGEDLGEFTESAMLASILGGEVRDAALKKVTNQVVEQVLGNFGYPSSLQQFIDSEVESEGTIQNRIHSTVHALLKSPELAEAYKTPTNHDKTDASIQYLENIGALAKDRKANVIPNTPVSISAAYKNSTKGKNNTGIAVNANTAGTALAEYKFSLKAPINIAGNLYSEFALDNKALERDISDANSTAVTNSVDNANKPVSEDLNSSAYTIPHRALMINLGVTSEENPNKVDLEFIDSYFNLPIIKEYVNILEAEDRQVAPVRLGTSKKYEFKYISRLTSVLEEMQNWASHNKNVPALQTTVDALEKRYQEIYIQSFNKKDLEKVHAFDKTRIFNEPISNMSFEQLQELSEILLTELTALNIYYNLDSIAAEVMQLSILMSLNRQITTDMSRLTMYQRAVDTLRSDKSEFTPTGITNFLSNPNVKSNLDNINEIVKISQLYFLDHTSIMTTLMDSLFRQYSLKMDRGTFKRDFLSFLTMKLLKKETNRSYDSYYGLIVPGIGTTIIEKYNKLTKTDAEGNPLKPEFYFNAFIKAIEPKPASDSAKASIDIISMDSRTKFSLETIDMYMDSITALMGSEDSEIKEFGVDLIRYLIIKDALQFRNMSFIKFIPATIFNSVTKVLKKLNTGIAYKSVTDSIVQDLTGLNYTALYDEFHKIYGTQFNHLKDLVNYRFNYAIDDGDVINDNLVNIENSDVVAPGVYKVVEVTTTKDGLTLTQLTNRPFFLERSVFAKSLITSKGYSSIDFPAVIRLNGSTGAVYVVKSRKSVNGLNSIEYQKLDVLSTRGVLPYAAEYEATKKASNQMKKIALEKLPSKKSPLSLEEMDDAALLDQYYQDNPEAARVNQFFDDSSEDNTPPGMPNIPRSPKKC